MKDERKRLGMGLVAAVVVHLSVAVLLGAFGYTLMKKQPQVLEVTLAGGGSAGGAVQQEAKEENSIVRSIEDIIDKKLKPASKPQTVVQEKKKTSENLQPQSQTNEQNNGTKPGTGKGKGEGAGEGQGSGSGTGSGDGEGAGNGTGEGHGVPTIPPRPLSTPPPVYPSSLRSAGIEGTAVVRLLVGTDGKVETAELAASSGNTTLDESALKAVRKWRFSPAKDKFGQKARCYVSRNIVFSLKK